MTVPARVQLEPRQCAHRRSEGGCRVRTDFYLLRQERKHVTRDSYNSLKNKSIVSTIKKEMKAHPVLYQPERNEITKAGLSEVATA
jgi:hypothetical protein